MTIPEKIDPISQRFEENWTQWIMETAYRWEDLSDVIRLTGIDIVDNDHKKLVEYSLEFNRLFDLADKGGYDLDFILALEKLFAQLLDFTKEHFDREEELIIKLGIPGIEKQQGQHIKIIGQLKNYIYEVESGKLNIALQFKSTFMEWLAYHINFIDYYTFQLKDIAPIILTKALSWEDTRELIRSMGINQMDEDHKLLTEYTLNLNALISDQSTDQDLLLNKRIPPLIEKIINFAKEHFDREETFITRYRLPGLERQKGEHKVFIDKLANYLAEIQNSRVSSLKTLKTDILSWWVNHINLSDYQSFKEHDWAGDILFSAKKWEDISDLIYLMGIESVDVQHRTQTEKILALSDLIESYEKQRENSGIFNQIIEMAKEILTFAQKHFAHEESILLERKVPNLDQHLAEHYELLNNIQQYIENIQEGRLLVSKKLKILFGNWWINHINSTDLASFKGQ